MQNDIRNTTDLAKIYGEIIDDVAKALECEPQHVAIVTTELVLFGTRGRLRTLAPGRRQVNFIATRKREHSRKPDELYDVIEACSPGPYLELFARGARAGWQQWGEEAEAA